MTDQAWHIQRGDAPLVAAAVHDGHDVRPAVAECLALQPAHRRREEDPYTSRWTHIAPTRIVGRRSRFEVDLNRPPEKAIYRTPDDAWGLAVWNQPPSDQLVEDSLAIHRAFYAEVSELLQSLIDRHGRIVVLDLHSYNHCRDGAGRLPADPAANPDVNIGTGTMNRDRWGPIVDRFINDLSAADVLGRRLDVRENVRFRGGYFPRWIHETFPETACAIAVEVKKFFMDEWTGEPFAEQIEAVGQALAATVPGLLQELKRL